MPPKKKGKGGKKKGGGSSNMVDGVATAEMTKEQLEQHVFRLREEMEREREERNFFQLERDKIRTFWEITRQQLEERLAELRNKDREMEEAEEKHQAEIKAFKQELKHLMYEHQQRLSELRAENMVALKLEQDGYTQREEKLLQDKQELKAQLKEEEISSQDCIRGLKLKHSEELAGLRSEFERRAGELQEKAEVRLCVVRADLKLRLSNELAHMEESKDQELVQVRAGQDLALDQMREYYKNVIASNMALITNLKEELVDARKKETRLEQQLSRVRSEDLSLPLQRAQQQLEDQARLLATYDKDKASLASMWQRLKALQKKHDELKRDHNALEVQHEKLESEVIDLRTQNTTLVAERQKATGLVSVVQEHKLKAVTSRLEVREAQLNQILSTCHTDPAEAAASSKKLEEMIEKKNSLVSLLQFELAKACKAHNDMLRTLEARLKEYGVPTDDLGFIPLRPNAPCPTIRPGPSPGLIAIAK